MKILFTGFTSRTVGSDRNVYDYMSNVFVLQRALELAGHDVTARPISLLEDPCIDEDYDVAIVGIAACQGLSSRFKLGGLWALHKFGSRAGIFPSDGKNLYVFPGSVRTCLTGDHKDNGTPIDPIDYMLGALQRERNNVLDHELGADPSFKAIWRSVLERLPHSETSPKCAWPMLIPTHTWGDPVVYARHFGADVTAWDPTNVAIPMQFVAKELGDDGRLLCSMCGNWNGVITTGSELSNCPVCRPINEPARKREWVVTSLQDQSGWLKKQGAKWPVVIVGNKRAARKGEAIDYIPEKQMIAEYYTKYWGHLAFGYPLADGGWWRMRYVHAGMAGIVTCCDPNDARRMPEAYQHSRIMLERFSDEKLAEVARDQWLELQASALSVDETVSRVNNFVLRLKS